MAELEGKVAIITGAAVGLGRGIALAFAKAGGVVVGFDVNENALATAVEEISGVGPPAHGIKCDITIRSEVEGAVAETIRKCGRIDILVNNAMLRPPVKPLIETTEDDMLMAFKTGPMASAIMMQVCFPHLKRTRGRVIGIGSAAGIDGHAELASYSMSKAAHHTLTKVAAKEWGPHGITVNAILPAALTEKLAFVMRTRPETIIFNPPLGRLGDPEIDIGAVAVFLASSAAGYLTGQNIPVDGGALMMR